MQERRLHVNMFLTSTLNMIPYNVPVALNTMEQFSQLPEWGGISEKVWL